MYSSVFWCLFVVSLDFQAESRKLCIIPGELQWLSNWSNEQTPKTQWNTSQVQSEESHVIHVREASDLPKDSEEVPSGT